MFLTRNEPVGNLSALYCGCGRLWWWVLVGGDGKHWWVVQGGCTLWKAVIGGCRWRKAVESMWWKVGVVGER